MSSRAELNKIIPAFTAYKFLQTLIQPFTEFEAYKLGIIDKNGNFIKKISSLKTSKEKKAAAMFFRIIINLKKLIAQIPNPSIKQRLKTLPTSLFLIKEEVEKVGGDPNEIERMFYEFVRETNPELYEEIANSMGGTFSNPQVGEGNPNLAGPVLPLGFMRRKRKRKKDEDE